MSFRLTSSMVCALAPLCAIAGSLRVGPTRLDLSVRHPVAVLEVQNTGTEATLAQLDAFAWTQAGAGDLLDATGDLVTTPLVVNLAPGETRLVRVGLREPGGSPGQPRMGVERSYRVFVREVPPVAVPESGLRFAVRIGVPVFVVPAELRIGGGTAGGASSGLRGAVPGELTWRWLPDLHGCASVQIFNASARHDRVLVAEMLSHDGEVLWRSSEPAYVLAGSRRALPPAVCAPSLREVATLRLTTDSRTVDLAVEAPALSVDANPP